MSRTTRRSAREQHDQPDDSLALDSTQQADQPAYQAQTAAEQSMTADQPMTVDQPQAATETAQTTKPARSHRRKFVPFRNLSRVVRNTEDVGLRNGAEDVLRSLGKYYAERVAVQAQKLRGTRKRTSAVDVVAAIRSLHTSSEFASAQVAFVEARLDQYEAFKDSRAAAKQQQQQPVQQQQ